MISEVSNAQVLHWVELGYSYLDVRSEAEFEAGHVPGAYNIPLSFGTRSGLVPNPDFLEVVRAGFGVERPLLLGCHSGGRARRAAEQLRSAGFRTLAVHREGWGGCRDAFGRLTPGWNQGGFPRSTASQEGRDYASLARAGQNPQGASRISS